MKGNFLSIDFLNIKNKQKSYSLYIKYLNQFLFNKVYLANNIILLSDVKHSDSAFIELTNQFFNICV